MYDTPRSRRSPDAVDTPGNIGEEWPPFLILACITLLFLSQTPAVPVGAQLACILGGIGGLVATLAVCRGFAENIGRAALKAPLLLLLLLTGYATFRFLTTPPEFKLLATVDLLRIYGGGLAFFACAYILGTARQLGRLVIGILLFAVFVAFADFNKFGSTAQRSNYFVENTSVLGLHMTVGGFLAMLLPVVAAFAFLPGGDDKHRLTAQLTFLVIGFALILARSRSGWVAGAAALLVIALLIGRLVLRERWRRGTEPVRPRRGEHPVGRLLNSPYLWVVAGIAVLIVGGGISGVLQQRGADLGKVASGNIAEGSMSLQLRVNYARGALLMIRDKPVTGFGLGGYMVEQGKYTHTGDEPIKVLRSGTAHQNRAHNYYLQWAVDTGLTGLFLHGAFVTATLFALLRGIPVAPSPVRRALAIGAVGAIVAGAVDALASPMYHLHGTYALWLAWAGIGLGALRADPPRPAVSLAGETPATAPDYPSIAAPTPIVDWLGAGLVGAALVTTCVVLGNRVVEAGKTAPPGRFMVTIPREQQYYDVRPGTRITAKSFFRDGNGVERQTSPGTRWEIAAKDDLSDLNAAFSRLDGKHNDLSTIFHSGFTVVIPPGAKSRAITIIGHYNDDYGRPYRFAVSVKINPDAPEPPGQPAPGQPVSEPTP